VTLINLYISDVWLVTNLNIRLYTHDQKCLTALTDVKSSFVVLQ